jgi:uncharacterized protein (DUF1800 family)
MAPTSFAPTARTLEVPGARLYYEVRGKGPLVVLVGAPMDATSFAPLADLLADDYTVLTIDTQYQNTHMLRPTTHWQPDIAALRSPATRVVVGIGEGSAGQVCDRTSRALATVLGTEPTMFPGGHTGFAEDPAGFRSSEGTRGWCFGSKRAGADPVGQSAAEAADSRGRSLSLSASSTVRRRSPRAGSPPSRRRMARRR